MTQDELRRVAEYVQAGGHNFFLRDLATALLALLPLKARGDELATAWFDHDDDPDWDGMEWADKMERLIAAYRKAQAEVERVVDG